MQGWHRSHILGQTSSPIGDQIGTSTSIKVRLKPRDHLTCTAASLIRKVEAIEEIEILKAASSKHLLNDVIAGQNDPIYKLLPTSVV